MKIGLLSDTHGWLDSKILDFFKKGIAIEKKLLYSNEP